jgi:hypothetical protein
MNQNTQLRIVARKLLKEGVVDNFWAFNSRTSLRLGAIIFVLKGYGWHITGAFGKEPTFHAKNYYYTLKSRPTKKQMDKVFGVLHK